MVALTRRPVCLTIAGSDSSGGAGVVADLKTFEALGAWGCVAVTAVTAQDSEGVTASHLVPPALIEAQIAAVASDLGVDAAKTGMLGSAAGVRAVVAGLRAAGIGRLVVDPVLVSSHGNRLLSADALDVLRRELLPMAMVVTPNLPEAGDLLGIQIVDRASMIPAAEALRRLGPQVVLLKGGHLPDRHSSPDLVCSPDGVAWLEGPRSTTVHTHGTGCVLSAAVAAGLALGGDPVAACVAAKQFVTRAIEAGRPLGRGVGPVDPGWRRSG